MSAESEFLRDEIRAGRIECFCPAETKALSADSHAEGCSWDRAIRRIYEIERAEEAKS